MGLRIKPKGTVHVGQERRLVQHVAAAPALAGWDSGGPVGMTAIEYVPRASPAGELQVERLDYQLESTRSDLAIVDDGLVTSYGIFGAPGCGKTHLLMYLLHQLLQIACESPSQKFGALILDPKSVLIDDVRIMVKSAGREDDLIVLNTDLLNMQRQADPHAGINVVDLKMDPYELGVQLVMASQASGTATSDPYWMLAWGNLFGAALELLRIDGETITLSKLLEETLSNDPTADQPTLRIKVRSLRMRDELATFGEDARRDALIAMDTIDNFNEMKEENAQTVKSIIISAYRNFERSKYLCYSVEKPTARSLYESIVEDGRIVLVSFSPSDPSMAKTLCTLIKNLFQRWVLGRFSRNPLGNCERPLIVAADEYSQVACELQGKPLGDGDFFSQARQFGCMGLLATQSVDILQASSLKENWKAVFANLGAKVFMRSADNDTTEEAVKLGGKSEFYITGESASRGKDGLSTTRQKELRERDNLPSMVLTQVLSKGQGVILGSLDGSNSTQMHFVQVPADLRPVSPADRKGWKHAEQ